MEGAGEGEVVGVARSPTPEFVIDSGSVCSRHGICDDLCELMFQSTNALATLILVSFLGCMPSELCFSGSVAS